MRASGEWALRISTASSIQELYRHVCKTPKKLLKILYSTCLRSHQIGATVQEQEVALEQINRIKHLKPSQLWFCFWLGGFPTLWFCLVVNLFQLSHHIIQYSTLGKIILPCTQVLANFHSPSQPPPPHHHNLWLQFLNSNFLGNPVAFSSYSLVGIFYLHQISLPA